MSTHIPSPTMHVDLKTSTMRQAQATELFNRRGELTSAIADLQRVKANAGRGNRQAAIDGYNRVWSRIERIARAIHEMTGEESEVPAYDPPLPLGAGATVKIGAPDPLEIPLAPPKPSKKIPKDIPVGSARWYRAQGQTPPEGCMP